MAVVSSYGAMQSSIAYELGGRSDLTTQIQNAIQTAIAKWERTKFYFNEVNDTNGFSTVAGQEFYTSADHPLIGSLVHIDKIHAFVSNNRYTLTPRTWQYIEDYSVNPTVQAPPTGLSDFAYYAETLRFYPLPDGAYPITISGIQRLTSLVNDTDSNAWTNDAEALIRCEAKLDIYTNILKEHEQAQAMKMMIYGDPMQPNSVGYLSALQAETFKRMPPPRVRPTYF
ncbi:MAG: hypothetical protein KGL39_24360 [Patescibacteria group bacterium]|nr:hypothetical protein [Patescibacteria group bacterium]